MATDELSRDEAEAAVRRAWDTGDMGAATTEALQRFGPEILGLLIALHHDEHEASDVFSAFSERLWQTFARFERRCSVRTWAYLLARRASHDFHRRERAAHVPLSQVPEVAELVAKVRSETLPHLRTQAKEAIAHLRDELPEADRTLLILRVDRELGWDELARVFLGDDEPNAAALKRESARLRKRFQLVKARLLEMGKARGLFRE